MHRLIALISLFLIAHGCVGCVGTFDAANTPPQLAPSTTRAHCVALDIESDVLPPAGGAFAAIGTGIGAIGATEPVPSTGLKVAGVITGAVGLGLGAWGLATSKSWHEQCIAPEAPAQPITAPLPSVQGLSQAPAPTAAPTLAPPVVTK